MIYTIKQKQSNSDSIHDLECDWCDRDIKFCKGGKFAVILASYYGGKGYTTHKTARAAIKASRKVKGYSHQIIDTIGDYYVADSNTTLTNIM